MCLSCEMASLFVPYSRTKSAKRNNSLSASHPFPYGHAFAPVLLVNCESLIKTTETDKYLILRFKSAALPTLFYTIFYLLTIWPMKVQPRPRKTIGVRTLVFLSYLYGETLMKLSSASTMYG